MIEVTFYRSGKYRNNYGARGTFVKEFKSVEDLTAFIYKISPSEVYVYDDNLSPAQRLAMCNKIGTLWKKYGNAGRRKAHRQ